MGASPSSRLLIAGIGILAVLVGSGCTGRPSSNSVVWTKAWSDTFAGPAGSPPDARYWEYDRGVGVFGTGEVETMTSAPTNVHLDGQGDLDITPLDSGSAWTSARIQTKNNKFVAPAGGEMMVTASIKQPDPAAGLGYWPGFWMLGNGVWPAHGEVDILEDVNALGSNSGTLHCGNLTQRNPDGTFGPCHESDGQSSGLRTCSGCESGYHTYSVIMDRRNEADQQIRWYLDGKEYFSVSESKVGTAAWAEAVDHGFSIILDVAIGGSYPNVQCGCKTPTSQTSPGATMSAQYVSVYTTMG